MGENGGAIRISANRRSIGLKSRSVKQNSLKLLVNNKLIKIGEEITSKFKLPAETNKGPSDGAGLSLGTPSAVTFARLARVGAVREEELEAAETDMDEDSIEREALSIGFDNARVEGGKEGGEEDSGSDTDAVDAELCWEEYREEEEKDDEFESGLAAGFEDRFSMDFDGALADWGPGAFCA